MGFGLKESEADAHPHSSGIGRNATPGITATLSAYAALQAAQMSGSTANRMKQELTHKHTTRPTFTGLSGCIVFGPSGCCCCVFGAVMFAESRPDVPRVTCQREHA